jgi:hypothetical protein
MEGTGNNADPYQEHQITMLQKLDRMRADGKLSEMAFEQAVKSLFSRPTAVTMSTASPPNLAASLTRPRKAAARTAGLSPIVSERKTLLTASPETPQEPSPLDEGQGESPHKNGLGKSELMDSDGPGNPDMTSEGAVDTSGCMSQSRHMNAWQPPAKTGFTTKSEAAKYLRRLPNKYLHLYNGRQDYSVYGCSSHLSCPSKVRIRRSKDSEEYLLEYNKEEHSQAVLDEVPRRGLPQVLRAEVDRRLMARDSPNKVMDALQAHDEYKIYLVGADKDKLWSLIRNRSRVLSRQRKGPLLFENCNDLMNWAAAHQFPATQDGFDNCDKNALHVLPEGYRNDIRGVVFSSLEVVQNMVKAIIDRPYGYSLMLDGTHKFHWGGWVLLTVGVVSLDWKRETSGFSQSFRPVAYCFCESENHDAAAMLLNSVRAVCRR